MNKISCSRRRFLSGAIGLSSLALLRPNTLFAENVATTKPAHTFCAFEKPLQFLAFDDLANVMADAGYNGLEAAVRDKGHVLPERVEEELPQMHEALKKRGLEITILASSINSVDSPQAEKVLRAAAKLGIKRYRMLWYQYDLRKPILPQLDALRPKVKDLVAMSREIGVRPIYQNHSGDKMVGGPLWDIYDLIKDYDPKDIALAYDIRHATTEGGLSWPLQFNLVKSHLGAVYVKDFMWEKHAVKNVPLGQGIVEKSFFTMLRQTGFAGPISVHVEYLDRSKDKQVLADAFRKDLATLKQWV